jgi:hypothetical protein
MKTAAKRRFYLPAPSGSAYHPFNKGPSQITEAGQRVKCTATNKRPRSKPGPEFAETKRRSVARSHRSFSEAVAAEAVVEAQGHHVDVLADPIAE